MLRLILLFALTLPAFAGGALLLSIGNPAAVNDPAVQGAIATARVTMCHGLNAPAQAMNVKAVGVVGGKRVSMPVRVTPLHSSGLVAIHWTRPAEGQWQLEFTSSGRSASVDVGDRPLRPQSHAMGGW